MMAKDATIPPASRAQQTGMWLTAQERGKSIERNAAAVLRDPSRYTKVANIMMTAAMDGENDGQIRLTITITQPGQAGRDEMVRLAAVGAKFQQSENLAQM